MIRSMTGFGRCRQTVDGLDITVEIKSVNSRFFDCTAKLPRSYSFLEDRVKAYLKTRGVSRGKVDVWVNVEVTESPSADVRLDTGYLKGYLAALERLRDEFGLKDDISVMSVARNPEIFKTALPEEDTERDWKRVETVLSQAADTFLAVRAAEGERIAADLREKLEGIRRSVDEIERLSADDISSYRERLAERIREALADNQIQPDEQRLLTECAIHADKVAVDEELVRLRTHFAAFGDLLCKDEPVGRNLDFLLQEMNREINTTGSKCSDAAIAQIVVSVKCELEKLREQIQNLE